MKPSQNKWVAEMLIKYGRVTRNKALNRNITRLASRIRDLKDAGWEILGSRTKKDYEYTLIKTP